RRPAPRRPVARKASPARPASVKVAPKPVQAAPPPPTPPLPVRKPTYHEAVAMYERGLQALQRRDFAASAEALRNVIEPYPDERGLLEGPPLFSQSARARVGAK